MQKLKERRNMVVDVCILDILMMNVHDDIVYLDKPTRRQPSAMLSVHYHYVLGTVAAPRTVAFDDDM